MEEDIISHAFLRYIRPSKRAIVPIEFIKEFSMKKPQNKDDFEKKALYSVKINSKSRQYKATEIYCIGSLEDTQQERDSGTRHKATVFNVTDINSKDWLEPDSEESDHEISLDDENIDVEDDDNEHPYTQPSGPTEPSKSIDERADLFMNQRFNDRATRDIFNHEFDEQQLQNINNENIILSEKLVELSKEKEELKIKLNEVERENQSLKLKINLLQGRHVEDENEQNVASTSPTIENNSSNPTSGIIHSTPKKSRAYVQIPMIRTDDHEPLDPVDKICLQKDSFSYPDSNTVSYNELNAAESREEFLHTYEIDGEQKTYLGFGQFVSTKVFDNIANDSPTCSVATKSLARLLWPNQLLAQRFIKIKVVMRNASDNRTERKVVTPRKMLALRVGISGIIKKRPRILKFKNSTNKVLDQLTHFISEEISDTIKEIDKARRNSDTPNPIRQLVEEIVFDF